MNANMYPANAPAASPASGTLDVGAILARYARNWPWFLGSLLLALLVAFLFLRYTTPKYAVTSRLLIRAAEKEPNRSSNNQTFQDLDIFNATTTVENETEALTSRHLLEQVLAELALNVSYFRPGKVHDVEIYGPAVPVQVVVGTVGDKADKNPLSVYLLNDSTFELTDGGAGRSRHRFGEQVRKPYGTFTVLRTPGRWPAATPVIVQLYRLADVAEDYSKNLTVEATNKKSSVLEITLLEAIPAKGKAVVNKLIEVYNRENKADRNALAVSTIRFIDDRLVTLAAELTGVEKQVAKYKSQNAVTNITTEATIYGNQSETNTKQLTEATIQLNIMNSLARYLTQPGSNYRLVPSNLGMQDPTLVGLVTKFNEVQLERERMLRTTEANNPLVVNMNEQLANLRGSILENLRNIKSSLGITRGAIVGNRNTANANIKLVPTIERNLMSISRQQGVKQSLYQFLLQKREESALSLAATGSNTRLLDPALVSLKPVKPLKPLVYLLALMAGLLLPLAFISIKGLLSDRLDTRAAVAEHTAAPVLGAVGRLNAGQLLPAAEATASPAAEAYHFLRHSLLTRLAGQPAQVLLFTAGQKDEGQTVVALNLAASLSTAGQRVVVLDLNLRTPHLGRYVKGAAETGVADYLGAKAQPLAPLLHEQGLGRNVSWLAAGPVPANPTELMASPRLAELFAELKSRFDHIIVLTAPVGEVADAFALAPFADACLYVVRLGHARAGHLAVLDDIVTGGKFKNPLVVLNDGLA